MSSCGEGEGEGGWGDGGMGERGRPHLIGLFILEGELLPQSLVFPTLLGTLPLSVAEGL